LNNLQALTSLRICDDNDLTADGARHLSALRQLSVFHVGGKNKLRVEDLKSLKQLTSCVIETSGARLGVGDIRQLEGLEHLVHLAIGRNEMSAQGAHQLSALRNLKSLKVGDNNSLGVEGAKGLQSIKQLSALVIGDYNNLTDQGALYLVELENLRSLIIGRHNGLTVKGKRALKASGLENLEIKTCGIGDLEIHAPENEDPLWIEKTRELAGRGITLESLLNFQSLLVSGNVMPNFDPRLSTTNDVVRQAIIPLSRSPVPADGGRALASVWSEAMPLVPQRIVVHKWGNRFVHLVAAIVADALQIHDGYEALAMELSSPAGVMAVMMRARSMHALDETYWVCCFSINQHSSICGGFGPPPPEGTPERLRWEAMRRDTATGCEVPVCDCCQPKHFNDDFLECELNKCDDLMNMLATSVEDFAQVVVCDESFDLLYNGWCVAELIEARFFDIPQSIQVHSAGAVARHYSRLVTYDAVECNCSRPEDKELILARIPDIVEFNGHVKMLVLGEKAPQPSSDRGVLSRLWRGR